MALGGRRATPLTRETAADAARRWLARRDYSQVELRERLQREGLTATEAGEVVAELADGLWQDDARFATMLVRSRAHQGKGPRLIAAELSAHGLDAAQVATIADSENIDWTEVALASLRRCQHADPLKRYRYLQRKGFLQPQIEAALRSGAEAD